VGFKIRFTSPFLDDILPLAFFSGEKSEIAAQTMMMSKSSASVEMFLDRLSVVENSLSFQ